MAERRRYILGSGGSDDQGGAARRAVQAMTGGRVRLPTAANDNTAPLALRLVRLAVLGATAAGIVYLLVT